MSLEADKKFTILHTEWSEGWGGQELRILSEMKIHQRMGQHLFLLCPPGTRLGREAETLGIRVFNRKIRQPWDLGAIRYLQGLVEELGVDVLHTHSSVDSWAGALAARWSGTPALVRTRHISVPAKRPWFNRLYYFPDAIITAGEHIRRDLLRTHKIPAGRVVSIPTGVDTAFFYPRPPDLELKKSLGLAEEALVISLVAVLRTQKRHELVLSAARRIIEAFPQARFLFVGEGPGRERIQKAIAAQGLESFFIMTGHRTDIPEILALTDVGVIASSAEGVPQFLLQALAMGKPVVATRVGGIPEIITSGVNGLLIPPEDPQALAAALLELLGAPDRSGQLGTEGRKLVAKEHTLERMGEQVLDVYRQVCREKKSLKTHD
ncbi:MAG: glycosyltransferase family 4 protein [Deltaproteobacteria bacterium]|nr:glycosyltransferase family 4 protein [Deltaproteobacteria bacterium]